MSNYMSQDYISKLQTLLVEFISNGTDKTNWHSCIVESNINGFTVNLSPNGWEGHLKNFLLTIDFFTVHKRS